MSYGNFALKPLHIGESGQMTKLCNFLTFMERQMRKRPTTKRPYFTMESAMTVILRDASGKMHHGILFDHRLFLSLGLMDQFDYA